MTQRFVNREAGRESGERVDFSFGENWRRFLETLDDRRITQAEASLRAAFGGAEIDGRTFLDLGCGSGLFSLCAFRLGATGIVSVDVDPSSVACARELKRRAGEPSHWEVVEGSVLDAAFLEQVAPAERVYSWGVLHHTGAMWRAIDNALSLVEPGGLLCLALYNRPNRLRLQLALKRTYNRLPRSFRPALAGAYAVALLAALAVLGQRNPVAYVRRYGERSRGMSFWRDIADWLGGLPFEYTDEAELRAFVESRGFEIVSALERSPGGNNDYLLRRRR